MSHKEWQSAPWWVQRVYIEGMFEEQLLKRPEDQEGWELDPVGADMLDFKNAGFKVLDGG